MDDAKSPGVSSEGSRRRANRWNKWILGPLRERRETALRTAVEPSLEVLHPLLAGPVSHQRSTPDTAVDPSIPGQLRLGIAGHRHAEIGLLQVALFERTIGLG